MESTEEPKWEQIGKEITSNYDATALLEKIREGEFSAKDVTVAFCKRAAISQQLTNCLTEIFFEAAIARAELLDEERRMHPEKPFRPFHGLPISLKDSFQIPGLDATVGIACFAYDPAEEYSALPALLLDLGAVLYCKTNIPQTMMTADSDNNVFGRTLNPHNTALTAGGSSGGEGALVALRGSVLGVGTDVAGRIRIPSLCCGIYGFKGSVGIVPYGGQRSASVPGMTGIVATAGPMASSFRDCRYFMEAIMQAGTWRYDSTSLSLPWKNLRLPAHHELKIGVADDDGLYTPHPAVRRVMEHCVARLKLAGATLTPVRLPGVSDCVESAWRYFSLAGSQHTRDMFSLTGEPVVPSLKLTGLLEMPKQNIDDLFALNVLRAKSARQYHKLFIEADVQAILMPPAPHTAVPHDTWKTASYTALWNYLDYPACVIPIDKVRASDVVDSLINAKYGTADEENYRLYTGPEEYIGAPACIQLVGFKHADEALTGTAAVVDSIVNGR
ncbi:hypothetical protein M1821_007645 [Neofusicoccum parvum]|uniref:Uncharacterized protein n=1 Tax=Neofusicoccum parvum TaxID=310453 RepID=A0ACB5SCH3_9PEZI|nr:hypothetical protein M1821_007645 [Neofusicoccum parvum]